LGVHHAQGKAIDCLIRDSILEVQQYEVQHKRVVMVLD